MDRDEFDDQVSRPRRRSRCSATRGGRPISATGGAAPAGRPGAACTGSSGSLLSNAEMRAAQRELSPHRRPPTGPRPTARCWTSSSTCWDRCPSRGAPRSRCSSSADAEFSEVVTTADRLVHAARGRPVRAPARDVRAHPGRRGAGHHADAVADAAAPRGQRELDDRRRPRAELLARRRRGRARDQRDHRHRTGTPVPDEHQLPQPGGGVRPGRPKVVVAAFPQADLPKAVRSTGIEPELRGRRVRRRRRCHGHASSRRCSIRSRARSGSSARRRAKDAPRRTAGGGRAGRRRAARRWSPRWNPRDWSTTASW